MLQTLQFLSAFWPWLIGAMAIGNSVLWIWLCRKWKQDKRGLIAYLSNIVGTFSRKSDADPSASEEEQIDVFLADIRDVLQNPQNQEESRNLYERLAVKDESRLYLKHAWFERWYSVARALIEIYPLLGIVGTVFAIWAGLSVSGTSEPDKIGRVIQNFGESVKSTAFGLSAAILCMVVNAWLEPSFERLLTYSASIRDLVSIAKQRLALEISQRAREAT